MQPSTATLVTSNMTSSIIFCAIFLDNIPSKFQMPLFCWVFQVPIWKAFNDPMTLETFNLPMWAKEWSRSLQPSDIVTRPRLLQHKTMSLCLVRLMVSHSNICSFLASSGCLSVFRKHYNLNWVRPGSFPSARNTSWALSNFTNSHSFKPKMDGKIHVKSNLHLQINETKPYF